MLVFIDESWQSAKEKPDKKVGVLSAVTIHSRDFNEYSRQIWNLKVKHLGPKCGDVEIKGQEIFRNYFFIWLPVLSSMIGAIARIRRFQRASESKNLNAKAKPR